MSDASLNVNADGLAELQGALDFHSVPLLWPQLKALIERGEALQVSLAQVSSTNSAALALLTEAASLARSRSVELQFSDLPQDLLDIAELSNAAQLIGG